jgi:lipid-A-disaccharide synthase
MIIAGEASGDLHGARLVEALQRKAPGLFIFGIGGNSLKAAGVRILIDAATLSVVGITEVISKLPQLRHGMRCAKQALRELKPDLLILIDFPDFNLHVAAAAKKAGIPVLYYISPQIWAWRTGRVKKIGRLIDHMAVILPFEEAFYRARRVPVTFVGHPLLDAALPPEKEGAAEAASDLTIGLLPGSRDREVASLLPMMLAAAGILANGNPKLRFIVSQAPSVDLNFFQSIMERNHTGAAIELHPGPVDALFRKSDLIIAASGTVTLEAAIAGVPMVIVYKVSRLSYLLARILVQVRHIGLVNLIHDEPLVTELIQDAATAQQVADEVGKLISDPGRLQRMRAKLYQIRAKLGGPGASGRVADIALDLIKSHP